MMNNGWVKLHRQILEWEWFDDHNTYRLFTVLLLLANHKDTKWRGEIIKRGEVLTGRIQLSKITGLSEQQIRTSIKKLKSTSEITSKSTNSFSIIKLLNWGKYHDEEKKSTSKSTSNPTNEQPTSNHIQEGKEGKEIKNNINITEQSSDKTYKPKDITIKINGVLEFLKQQIGCSDFKESQKMQRIWGKHHLNLVGKLGKQDYLDRLKAILSDDFKLKNSGKLQYLYNEIKSFVPEKEATVEYI